MRGGRALKIGVAAQVILSGTFLNNRSAGRVLKAPIKKIVALLLILVVMPVFIAGAEEKLGHPKLEQKLYFLAQSEDPKTFAIEKGIELTDDKVRVIIELSKAANISSRLDITIEEQDKNLVQALVPVSALLDLADDPDVNYIKLPEKYKPLDSKKASFPSVSSWVAVLVVFLLIKIRRRRK